MRYTVILPRQVQKQLDRLGRDEFRRVMERLSELETNSRPPDVKKLRGRTAWRVRVGDYRIIYEIHDHAAQITIVTVGHRRDVYR